MARWPLKRIILVMVAMVAVVWVGFLCHDYFGVRQKSILRYQIERELSR